MQGETNLNTLLQSMKPLLNAGEFIFCSVPVDIKLDINDVLMVFKEAEGKTIIIEKKKADELRLEYHFVASWITLTVHSALNAVGLTAAFSKALTENQISCNVVAGYFHDHIFVDVKDTIKAMRVLKQFSKM